MITKSGAKKALKKRLEHQPRPIILRDDFPQQNAVVNDPARFIAVQCGRRSGKTNSLALRFFKTLERHPKSQCIYLALTRDSARNIIWPVLHELNDTHQMGCTFKDSTLTMVHPNGGKLRILGADMSNFIKRLKGVKAPGIAIDEAQDFGPHLQSLINDVLAPCISDYEDGWLAITGTPGPVPQGYFFEATHNRKFGYSFHEWTCLDNPYMPNPGAFIEEQKLHNEWDDNNPTLLREWRNKWVLDVKSLWVQYAESKGDYARLPDIYPHKWNYIMGIDLGFRDADAIAVLAWSEHHTDTHLVEEVITTKQGITELVKQIESLETKYPGAKMVVDEGGLGKKIAEELRRQKGLPIHQADKAQKQQNVAFLNDALRLGRFKAKKDSRFVQDSYLVQVDWSKSRPDKIIIKKTPHSDIIDSVLYAFKESPAYASVIPKPIPKHGTSEWGRKQQEDLWDEAVKHFEEQAELVRRIDGGGWG